MQNNPFLFDRVTPRVFFVDGPSGIGKDTYISYLTKYLIEKARVPDYRISVIRATDHVFTESTQSENRKYVQYSTEDSKLFHIFTKHFKLLEYIDKLLFESKADVVIVNRSFMSFLVYNVFPLIKSTDIRNTPYEDVLDIYKESNFVFPFSDVFYCNLTFKSKNSKEAALMLEKRITSREDGKEIDVKWLETIFNNYDEATRVYSYRFADHVSMINCEKAFCDNKSLPWLPSNLIKV